MYWQGLNIEEIKHISCVSGGYGGWKKEELNLHFTVTMKNDEKHHFHYNSRDAYTMRKALKILFNEVNNVEESFLLENAMYVEVDDDRFVFGCRVDNILDESEYLTNTQIVRLKKEGKIRDEGWRHLAYICPLKIRNKKIVRGELTDAFREELEALGIEIEEN